MGVPLLLTWLKRRFSPCFLPSSSCPATDCLYIDVNGLVYQAAALATASEVSAADIDAAILRRLFDLLDDIVLRLVNPRALVYLAVDGISPMGKLAQQRARRRRRSGGGSRGRTVVDWDSNSISVGTPFMSRLTEALHFYCATRVERINGERLRDEMQSGVQNNNNSNNDSAARRTPLEPITIVVDDVWRPGEGENKIADAIRRFRSQPNYDPNTSHVICSSDTDVTVCSLILHEPRIHVLRYEYPANNNNNSNSGGGNDRSSWRNQVGDAWSSTFFSIHAFREELRGKLRLQHGGKETREELERATRQFERSLHDVVFVLLLFGNDFLPSVGCRIEEGFLDDLLELLATDFISRDRSIIDPLTNTIQFDSARYALDALAEMRRERAGNCEGLLVDNGKEGAADWGFEDENYQREKQRREETEIAPQCYAYWTMLQWSLQNSAGVVEHWGCYYPYSTAPPLHLLRKYCGMLSYDSLMDLAKKRSCLKHNQQRGGGGGVATTADSSEAETPVSVWREGPANVLVQLLVLLPSRSSALLPSAVRNAYKEIEHIVLAPVEQIDFAALSAWCEKKHVMFTEEESTRFRAYALASSPDVLAKGEQKGMVIYGNEINFVADWDSEGFALEIEQAKSERSLGTTTTLMGEGGNIKEGENKEGSLPTNNTPTVSVSAFFGTRPVRKSVSAAAAALLTASKKGDDAPNHNEKSNASIQDDHSTSNDNNNNNNNNNNNRVGGNPGVTTQEITSLSGNVEVRNGRGFTLLTAPTGILGSAAMVKNAGSVVGDTFLCGHYTSSPLSRSPQTMRVRLRWRIASKPLLTSKRFVPDLLPGYVFPPTVLSLATTSRHEENRIGAKRPASAAASSSSNSGDSDDDNNKNEGDEDSSTRNVMTELEKKKEAVRRRLEALQARAGGNAL